MRALGGLLFLAGLFALGYFIFGFDTSIANPSGAGSAGDVLGTGRIGNLGLQNDRVCGCIGGAAVMISGAVLSAMGEVAKLLTPKGTAGVA